MFILRTLVLASAGAVTVILAVRTSLPRIRITLRPGLKGRSLQDASLLGAAQDTYIDLGLGKCVTEAGDDPKHSYHHAQGAHGCQRLCSDLMSCYGYSVSNFGNCLLWLEPGLRGGSTSWGGAHCMLKDLSTTTQDSMPTTTVTSAATHDFVPVTEAENQACRGATHTDNLAKHFEVIPTSDLELCKGACRSKPDRLCKGIEYSVGRCELWVRPEGIGATNGVPGCTCLRNTMAPVFVPVEGGNNRACRGASPSDNKASYYHVVENVSFLEACQAACMLQSSCVGIEFGGRCELWTRAEGIQAVAYLEGSICMKYELQV